MTDIEQKALALVRKEDGKGYLNYDAAFAALCRAIEQHEAFRQEVSGVMTYIKALYPTLPRNFNRFIIPAPKPDPLVAMAEGMGCYGADAEDLAEEIRAALDAAGFEIREKAQ